MEQWNALAVAHAFLRREVKPGALCLDATAGRGRDTQFLCELAGPGGRVLAFDIQPEAVKSTRERLAQAGLESIGQVMLESHEHMDRYVAYGEVDAIVFNLGWLPGGDHAIFTQPQSSLTAVSRGLELLRTGGVMSLCIYYGGRTGCAERDTLLPYLRGLDHRRFSVLVCEFCNRPNNPAIPVLLRREG